MIGGEFEINLSYQRQNFVEKPDTYYYASGRAALYQIIKSSQIKRVWLPDYLCVSVVEAVKKAGVEYTFFELDDNLDAKLDSLSPTEFDAVLLINYFGLKDLIGQEARLSELFPYTIIIEDDVQAFYEFEKRDNPYVDFRFTSLRKTFAVTDGGLVYTRHKMPIAVERNSFSRHKLNAGIMKSRRDQELIDDNEYLALFEKGESLLAENYESVMSMDSKMLFCNTPTDAVSQKRKDNAAYLLKGLNELGVRTVLPVPKDKTPLFIPIYLENRNEVRKQMFDHEIYCPVHWPIEGLSLKKGGEMAEHEISLIVDQRYSQVDMETILDTLNNCKTK